MAELRTRRDENSGLGGLGGVNPAKMMTRGAVKAGQHGRTALGDLANKVAQHQPKDGGVKPVKPGRGLARQKASSSLLGGVQTRRSAEQARLAPEPMDTQDIKDSLLPALASPVRDVEMAEIESKVEDIDCDDRENPQLAAEYVNEIYAYLRQLERKLAVRQNYLEVPGAKIVIKPRMRNLLIDWLIEVHQQFSLLQETLYLTVDIVDRFLQAKASAVSTKQLQLVGITAMFVASKYEEMYPPEIGDFVYISDHTYTATQIRRMEIAMMETLNFDFGKPLPLNFLRRNSKAAFVDAQTHALAKYVMELCVVEYKLAHVPPSMLAAAALAFSMRVLDPSNTSLDDLWTPTLTHYTTYRVDSLVEVLRHLAELVLNANKVLDGSPAANETSKKKLQAVSKKYSHKKFMKISLIPQLRGDFVLRLAEEGEL